MNSIVIDDDISSHTILKYFYKFFQRINFSNTIQVPQFLKYHSVDFILLKLQLPKYTGFDFNKYVKNFPYIIHISLNPNFPIAGFDFESIANYLKKPST